MCFGLCDKDEEVLRFPRSPPHAPGTALHFDRRVSSLERQLANAPMPNPNYEGHHRMPHKFGNARYPDGTGGEIFPESLVGGRQLYEMPEDRSYPYHLTNARGRAPLPSVGPQRVGNVNPGHSRLVVDEHRNLVSGFSHPRGNPRAAEPAQFVTVKRSRR